MATSTAAAVAGRTDLGSIAPGKLADMILVDGNPLEDVTILEEHEQNIRVVMKDGRVYKNTLTN